MQKTILITGCSRGIGRAITLRLAQKNCDILAVARNTHLLQEMAKYSEKIYPICADITESKGREKIYDVVKSKNKPLSIIHNAAIAVPTQFISTDETLFLECIHTNFLAPLLITQQLLPWLPHERVLHITSGAASLPLAGLLPYCATKAAMQQAIACLNVELNQKNIFCANLRPGIVDTDLVLNFRNTNAEVLPNKDLYVQHAKENKLIAPEVVAEFVSWVLLKTDNQLFSKTLWNIFDVAYHSHWLPSLSLFSK